MTIPSVPDEETSPLHGQRRSVIGGVTEPDSEAVTLADPSNQGSRTSNIIGKTSSNRGSGVVKKTPLPWAQFSIILFLQLAGPLTAQVIAPVSFFFIRSSSMQFFCLGFDRRGSEEFAYNSRELNNPSFP